MRQNNFREEKEREEQKNFCSDKEEEKDELSTYWNSRFDQYEINDEIFCANKSTSQSGVPTRTEVCQHQFASSQQFK
jgi:hypothetical protein